MDRRAFLKRAGLFVAATACANAPATATQTTETHDHPAGSGATAMPSGSSATVPVAEQGDIYRVEGAVTLDRSIRVPGIVIEPGATLTLAGDRDITIETSGNVLVLGTMASSPVAGVTHTLRFIEVDESGLVGGGMDVLDSDVGIWVMEAGRLDFNGVAKTAWSYDPDQPDWLSDDEVVITPTLPDDYDGFITTTAGSVAGQLAPAVGDGWTAELLNLTRNVRIEGSPEGRAHIFIHSSSPQNIRYVSLANLGPFGVLGRYPLHFHHSGAGSRGSIVEGVVAVKSGKHAFVPHMSEGITFTDCIAFDTTADAFWWDVREVSHDIVWNRCVAALVRLGDQPHRLSGFFLGGGDNNMIKDSVAVGVEGGDDTAGFSWPSSVRVGDWSFSNNRSHNNEGNGFWVWQNQRGSTVEDFVVYHNGAYGISHGAYNNSFVYRAGTVFGSGAASIKFSANGATFEDLTIDGGGITDVGVLTGRHPAQPRSNTLFINSPIVDHTGPKVLVEEGSRSLHPAFYDFVGCGLEESDVVMSGEQAEGTVLRAQDDNEAFAIDNKGNAEEIAPFNAELYTLNY